MQFGVPTGLTLPKLLFEAKSNIVTYPEILEIVQDMLHYALDEVTILLEIWINSKVPMDTGLLREDLLSSLHSAEIQEGLLNLIIRTDLPYADRVAAMSTEKVRHVIDPEAIGNFWKELQLYTEEITMTILQRAIEEYFGGTGSLMKGVRGN